MLAAKSSPHHILSIFTIIIIIAIIIIVVIVITKHFQAFKFLVYKWQTSSACPETCSTHLS
jgi:hypothetical protein